MPAWLNDLIGQAVSVTFAPVGLLTLCGLPALWYNGVLTREVVVLSFVSKPFYMVGTWLGARSFKQHGSRHYRNAALISLAIVGMLTLALAAHDYFG